MGFGGRHGCVFGVGACAEPDDAVAGFEVVEIVEIAGAGGEDGAFCFAAQDFGFWGWVEAGAEIAGGLLESEEGKGKRVVWGRKGDKRVNVVYAYEIILHQHFSFFWGRDWEVGLILQDFDSTGFLDENAFHGLWDGSHCAC